MSAVDSEPTVPMTRSAALGSGSGNDRSAPRLCLFIGKLEGGGSEKHVLDLARGLCGLGADLFVSGVYADPGTLRRYELAGVRVRLLPLRGHARVSVPHDAAGPRLRRTPIARRLMRPLRPLRQAAALGRLLRAERPLVVYSFLPHANLLACAARRLGQIPVLLCGHRSGGRGDRLDDILQRAEGWLCDSADLNIANSAGVRRFLIDELRLDPDSVCVVPNGVERVNQDICGTDRRTARSELRIDDGQVAAVIVANLWSYKGHADVLRALAAVRASRPDLRVFLIGRDEGSGDDLRTLARDAGIEASVTFLGERFDVCRLLPAFDLYLSPSHTEGMSNAILEAMAHGLPVIASDAAGSDELLDGGRAGILYPAGDLSALADGLTRLAGEAAERIRLGTLGRERAAVRFTLETMTAGTLDLFALACERRGFPRQAAALRALGFTVDRSRPDPV